MPAGNTGVPPVGVTGVSPVERQDRKDSLPVGFTGEAPVFQEDIVARSERIARVHPKFFVSTNSVPRCLRM